MKPRVHIFKESMIVVLWVMGFGGIVMLVFSMYPTRRGYIHFETEQVPRGQAADDLKLALSNDKWLRRLDDQVRMRLLADGRFVGAYSIPENQARRAMFHQTPTDWPLYGVKGSEFEDFGINADYIQGYPTRSLWISTAFNTPDRYSMKLRHLKALISEAFGEEAMRHVHVETSVESITSQFLSAGDGTQ